MLLLSIEQFCFQPFEPYHNIKQFVIWNQSSTEHMFLQYINVFPFTMPVLGRWDEDSNDAPLPPANRATAWRYDETSESSDSESGYLDLGL